MSKPSFLDRKIPEVRILGIQFQWDDSDITNSGIPIHPEEAGWFSEPRSHVAYSINSTKETVREGKLQIKARFHSSGGKGRIQIRARSVKVDPKDVILFEVHEKYDGQHALGDVAPTTVYFNDTNYSVFRGKYTYVPLKLENVKFPDLGVGIYDINWKWEFRVLDEEATAEQKKSVWKDKWHTIRTNNLKLPQAIMARLTLMVPFEMTKHRVFVTLDQPQRPWSDGKIPDTSLGLPLALPLWTRGLEVACDWAAGAKTRNEAATLITKRLYGSGRFVYNTNSNYVIMGNKVKAAYKGVKLKVRPNSNTAFFHFHKVLERLGGGYGLGPEANCFDCAMTVATLANILGCNLRVGKLQNMPDTDASDESHYMDNRFEINPVIAIGKRDVKDSEADLLYEDTPYFAYHTVAWEGPNNEYFPTAHDFEDPKVTVFDACINFLVEGDRISAAGLPLGNGDTKGSYINLLASDNCDGRPRCKPQPVTVVDIQLAC